MDDPKTAAWDAIVVGSGPGGATVARELVRRGKTVLILEWGPGGPDTGSAGQFIRQQVLTGRGLIVTNGLLSIVRGVTTGGSSVFYYATAFPVPLEMLSGYGVDIRDEVAEARRELPIGPLEDEMLTPMTQRMMDSARDLGFDWNPLDKFMHQDRWQPGFPFAYYGVSRGVKWTAREYVDEATRSGAMLVTNAKVTRVLVENGRAIGVEYRHGGKIGAASAEKVVIAAGGIGSPLILRASGLDEAGFDFFFDPLITVCGTLKDLRTRPDEIPMSTGVRMKDEGYVLTDMSLPPMIHAVFEAQVGRVSRLFSQDSTARILVKIKDQLGGRVTSRGGVRKKLSPEDRSKLRHGYGNAQRILKKMGATGIHKSWYAAAHPGGTVKIGQLLDARLETQIQGLHVCDCSVIPEEWGLPPTLTLIGLGKYLARLLSGENAPASPSPGDQGKET